MLTIYHSNRAEWLSALLAEQLKINPPLPFEEVNIIEEGEAVPSVVSELLIAIDTSADGWLFNFTVKVAVPPASVVEPVIALMTKPAGPLLVKALSLELTVAFLKSFSSLHDVNAAMKDKIRILKGHLLFNLQRVFILI